MKAAIVCLTRGYPNVNYYQNLINRNRRIYENFNKKLSNQYPLLIMHEGNISDSDISFIMSQEKNKLVRFINIKPDFTWPSNITYIKDDRFNLGYRLMCRFHTHKIWKYVKEYDYILRADEDAMLGNLDYDIFKYMKENNLDYMPSRFMHEYHDLTNETLPQAAEKLLSGIWSKENYDQTELWIPYTNLYAASVKFFLKEEVFKFLNNITNDPEFLINRWGDAPLHGISLKAFSSPEKIQTIPNFSYVHGSHHCLTTNGRAMKGIMSEYEAKYFDCVPSGEGDMHYIAKELVK